MDTGGVRNGGMQPLHMESPVRQDVRVDEGTLSGQRILKMQTIGKQSIGQPPLSTLGPSVRTGAKALESALDKWVSTAPEDKHMPQSVGVSMPPGGNTVRLDGAMVEDEISSLPEGERKDAVRNMPLTLQKRVNHGHELFTRIMGGKPTSPASTQDVRDLMTFLTAKGMEKSDGFSEGAFSIEDPGHKLRDYLDTCSEVYQRPSSHISEFTKATGGTHRGIDIGGDVKLPFGKATVLYGAMNKGVQDMPGDRLFIKMESHGCRLSSGSLGGKRDASGPADRPMRFWRDLKQTLGHAGGFFKTVLRKVSGGKLFPNTPDSRKERIPSDIKKEYKALVDKFKKSGDQLTMGILNLDKPLSDSRGIRTMVENLEAALGNYELKDGRGEIADLLDKISSRYDHLDVRVGDEMILNMGELDGSDKTKAAEGQLRAAVNSLLTLDGQGELTDAKVEKFMAQLTKMALSLEHAGGADDANKIIDQAIERATGDLGQDQKDALKTLLGSQKCKDIVGGMLDVVAMGGENLRGLSKSGKDTGARMARMISDAFIGLSKEVNGDVEPTFGQASRAGQQKAFSILTKAGMDSTIGWGTEVKARQQDFEAHLSEHRSGLNGTMGEKRAKLPGDMMVVGSHAKGLMQGKVDKETIGENILDGLEKMQEAPGKTGQSGLPQKFVEDFFRNGIKVNGQKYGGQGTSIPKETQTKQLDDFIKAVGGQDKAKQLAGLANRGLVKTMTDSMTSDKGMGKVVEGHTSYLGDVLGMSQTMSVLTHGDDLSVHMEHSEHRVSSRTETHESGMNLSLDFTLQGAGTDDPVVRLDDWDALFGSNDQKRTGDMGPLSMIRGEIGPGKFTIGPFMQGKPDMDSINDGIKTEVKADLLKTGVTTGYRGLPRDFIVDFSRRSIIVDGVAHGGRKAGVTEAEQHEKLDAFIEAVGGEAKAQTLTKVLFQNVAGIIDGEFLKDDALQPLNMDFLTNQGKVQHDGIEFALTTRSNGKVDVHLECSRHRLSTGPAGDERGRIVSLDYTVGGLGQGETPDIESMDTDFVFTSNSQRLAQ